MFQAVAVMNARRGLLAMMVIASVVAVGCGGGSGAGSNAGGSAGAGGYGNGGPYGGNGGNLGGNTLSLTSKPEIGNHLVSPDGRTLYYFALDVPAGAGQAPVSNCMSDCLPFWPIFHVDSPAVSAGLKASDFGEFVRPDGAKQTTFKGWPLYFFAGDTAAGDTKGDHLGEPRATDLWFVIKDPFYAGLIMTRDGGPIDYLADPTGRALYVFPDDTVGTATSAPVSACTDPACSSAWPAFSAAAGTLPTGLDPAKLTSFTRPDGAKQSAFDGHPLYYFVGDTAPGATSGMGVDGFKIAEPGTL